MDIQKEMQKAQEARRLNIFNSFSKEESNSQDSNDIQKSDIFNAIDKENNFKFSKTGKEIKQRVRDVLIPKYNAELEGVKSDINTLIDSCGKAPKNKVTDWWTDGVKIEIPFSIYDWEETYFENKEQKVLYSLSPEQEYVNKEKFNYPESKEMGEARRKYNDLVRKYCEILVDVKTLEILLNIKDEQKFDLTTRQVFTFGF